MAGEGVQEAVGNGIVVEQVSEEERRSASFGAGDHSEYLDQDDGGAGSSAAVTGPDESAVDAAAAEAESRISAAADTGDDGSVADSLDLNFSASERLRLAEERVAAIEREYAELLRRSNAAGYGGYVPQSGQRPTHGAGASAPTEFRVPDDLRAMLENPQTDPGVRAFVSNQVETLRQNYELRQQNAQILERIERIASRNESSDAAATVAASVQRATGIVNDLIKRHPLLSNGHPDNTHVGNLIREAVMTEYEAVSRNGHRIGDHEILPAFQKLLERHRPLIKAKPPKAPVTAQSKTADAVARQAAAKRDTTPPQGGSAGTATRQRTDDEIRALWNRENKTRFVGAIRKARESINARRHAAGVTV